MPEIITDPMLLKKCDNPLCHRQTTRGPAFCCASCGIANGKYEIHETGPLAHSARCDERAAWRYRTHGGPDA